MIFLDTETTDTIHSSLIPLAQQPYIVEFAAIKKPELFGNFLGKHEELHFLCDPGVPLSKIVKKVTGITDEDVKGQPSFAHWYEQLCDFFLGERVVVAHNVWHDMGCLAVELQRLDRLTQFPWAPNHVCTVEASQYFTGKYLKLTELHEQLFGSVPEQDHRAMADVHLLMKCYHELEKLGRV